MGSFSCPISKNWQIWSICCWSSHNFKHLDTSWWDSRKSGISCCCLPLRCGVPVAWLLWRGKPKGKSQNSASAAAFWLCRASACKAKMQHLITLKVSICCRLALQSSTNLSGLVLVSFSATQWTLKRMTRHTRVPAVAWTSKFHVLTSWSVVWTMYGNISVLLIVAHTCPCCRMNKKVLCFNI